MRFPLTDQLRAEAAAFALRSACRDCAFYLPRAGRCAHEWPNQLHRLSPLDDPPPAEVGFCKEFELR